MAAAPAPIGGSYNALLQEERPDKDTTPKPVPGEKRNTPDSGLTPPVVEPRRRLNGKDQDNEMKVGQTNDVQLQETTKRHARWSIKVSSEAVIPNPRQVLGCFSKYCTELKIGSIKFTQNKRIILIQSAQPEKDLNSMLSHVNEVNKSMKLSLQVDHFNVRPKRRDPTLAHVILKNVPDMFEAEDIRDELMARYEDKVENVTRIISSRTGKPTSLVRLVFTEESPAQQLIQEEKIKLWGVLVKCEAAYPRPTVLQCYKCQGIGHTQYECQAPQACAKCGENHRTGECTVTDRNAWKCVNCKGAHATWHSNCPVNIEHVKSLSNSGASSDPQAKVSEDPVPAQAPVNGSSTYRDKVVSGQESKVRHQESENLERENRQLKHDNELLNEKIAALTELFNTKLLKEKLDSLADIYNTTGKLRAEMIEQKAALQTLRDCLNEQFMSISMDIQWLVACNGGVCSGDTLRKVHRQRVRGSTLEYKYREANPKLGAIIDTAGTETNRPLNTSAANRSPKTPATNQNRESKSDK